jgi:hypothetical protein
LELGEFRLEVDFLDRIDDAFDSLGSEYLAKADLDRFRPRAPSGHFMKLGHQGVKGPFIDKRNLDTSSRLRKCLS